MGRARIRLHIFVRGVCDRLAERSFDLSGITTDEAKLERDRWDHAARRKERAFATRWNVRICRSGVKERNLIEEEYPIQGTGADCLVVAMKVL